jgi:hypothetical protein
MLLLLFPPLSRSIYSQENNIIIGLSGTTNMVNGYPYGGYINGGYEYKVTSSHKNYFALEGRFTSGFIFEPSEYNDLILGLSILPRFYYNIGYYNLYTFIDIQLGGNLQNVHSDTKNAVKLYPTYGARLGIKANKIAVFFSGIQRGVNNFINKTAFPSKVKNPMECEVGISYYFDI